LHLISSFSLRSIFVTFRNNNIIILSYLDCELIIWEIGIISLSSCEIWVWASLRVYC
jgi:hypothetical protein